MRLFVVTILALSLLCLATSVQAGEMVRSSSSVQKLRADLVLIEKAERRLTLFKDRQPIRTYDIALGRSPMGAKYKQGDKRTPEGFYTIDSRNKNSKFHLSLHISYPNERDLEIAELLNVPAGSNIMIHGFSETYEWMGIYHIVLDWTDGCIAVTNKEIEEIWALVPDGTEVQIKP